MEVFGASEAFHAIDPSHASMHVCYVIYMLLGKRCMNACVLCLCMHVKEEKECVQVKIKKGGEESAGVQDA